MYNYFLVFDVPGTAELVLYDDGKPRYRAIDVIGILYRPTGKTIETPEGPVAEMAASPGWHVNVRHDDEAPELDIYRVHPRNPMRVWA